MGNRGDQDGDEETDVTDEDPLSKPVAGRDRVRGLITGAWTTQVIHHGIKLGLFDALSSGPMSSSDLARLIGCDPDATRRLLRAFATLDLAQHLDGNVFALTADGHFLCSEAGSMRGVALHWGERLWKSFENLGRSVQSGRPLITSGADDFVALQNDPQRAAVFNRAMAEQSLSIGREVAVAYDFSGLGSVMDVGGGYGAVLRALLEKYPSLHGSVMDLPMLAEQAMNYLSSAGVAERARYLGGNFFESVPAGADAYVLKYIVHDWGDAEALQILTNCRRVAAPEGRVLLVEQIVPELLRPTPADQATIRGDLVMLTVGGRERTAHEYRALCQAAGLRIDRVLPTPSGFSVIETKVD